MYRLILVILFGYAPYIAVGLFILGIAYRLFLWTSATALTGMYNVNAGVNEKSWAATTKEVLKRIFLFYTLQGREKDPELFYGSFLFHWGIWIALFGHLGVFIPEIYLQDWFGLTPYYHHILALYVGGAGGLMAFAGMIILLIRRLGSKQIKLKLVNEFLINLKIKRFSFLDDYFADSLLILIIISGLAQTLGITSTSAAYIGTISTWVWSLFMLHPNVMLIAGYTLFQIHLILVMVFLVYFPWSKMMHPFSYLLMPTISRPSINIKEEAI
jgi:nitrate reductase gamma subunit